MVKDHSDSERGNPLPLHGLLFSISSEDSTDGIAYATASVIPVVELNESTLNDRRPRNFDVPTARDNLFFSVGQTEILKKDCPPDNHEILSQ